MKIGTKKSSEGSTKSVTDKIAEIIKQARHGDFFFAKFLIDNGQTRESPVFVISSENNDMDDVVVCKCTGQPAKTDFDIKVQLKKETYVRTNKIYTINRNQLLFKIRQTAQPDEYKEIINKIKSALNLN